MTKKTKTMAFRTFEEWKQIGNDVLMIVLVLAFAIFHLVKLAFCFLLYAWSIALYFILGNPHWGVTYLDFRWVVYWPNWATFVVVTYYASFIGLSVFVRGFASMPYRLARWGF